MRICPQCIPLFTLTVGCFIASGQTVPSEYQDIYSNLNTQISSFDSAVRADWNGSTSPVVYAPQLEAASSAQYTGLLATNYYSNVVLPELDELQALGAHGVKVQVSFPILYSPYYGSNQSLYESMLGFYQQLSTDIHARGMKLIVECTVDNQFPGDNVADFTGYYQTLSWSAYMAGRAQNALTTAQLMKPDYMSLITEPDSEARYTGQTNANTVTGSTQLLQTMLATLQGGGITGVSLGAGAGSWISSLTQYVQSFATTSVDYIDINVFPLNDSFLMNALTVASIAHAAGKKVGMSELWDFKIADSELGVLPLTQTSGRDPFSFWEPVDTAFLQAMSDFANYDQLLFICPFWSRYFFAYLNYDTYSSTPIGPLLIDSNQASVFAELTGASTPTGLAWLKMSIPEPDTIAPAIPATPVASNVFSTSAMLTWPATTDNVGVAAYKLYRNGSLIVTTSLLNYNDHGLSPGTAYAYTLKAVDASGNVSLASAPLNIETGTAIPPTVPGSFKAQAVSISQINLSWKASTSGIGLSGYEIYRGPSLANMAPYAHTQATTYSDVNVGPSLTYYYAALAYDIAGNQSSWTATIAVTTPVEAPPSTPGVPVALPLAYNQVSLTWPPSTSVLSIGGYLIFRGTSPTSLTQFANTNVSLYIDNSVSPATTYYYAVTAFDNDALQSGQSPVVSVTTPREPAPTAPSQLAGQATAYNQVTLSWSASTSVAGIWGYVVYRGTSPSTLNSIGTAKTGTTYADTTTAPSTTYYYAVVADDAYGLASAQSSTVTVVTPSEPAPSAPSHLAAQAVAYNNVPLSWSASTSPVGLWGYVVYRGTSPSALTAIASVKAGTTYTDTTTAPSTTYYYGVVADDVYLLTSAQSSTVSAVTPGEPAPSAPSHLTTQAVAYNNVALAWTASTSPVGLWGYVVYRGTSPSTLNSIGSAKTGTTYTDNATAPSTTYYYAVVANDAYGLASAQSSIVTEVTPKEPAPSAPSHLTAQAVAYNNVPLSWTASTSPVGLWGYVVYRGTSPSALTAIASVKTGTTYTDTTSAPSTTYYYAVEADDLYLLTSAQSSTATVVTPKESAPSTPSHLATKAVAYNSVTLSWTASSSPVGLWGYIVYRGTSPSTLVEIASSKTGTTYDDTNIAPSATYYYAVSADDVYGVASAQSSTMNVITPKEPAPSAPSHLATQAVAYDSVTLSWTASSSPVGLWGYVVYRGTSPSTLTAIGTVTTGTSYTDTSAAPATTYYYAAVSKDVYGLTSAQSSTLTVLTPKEPAPSAPSHLATQAVAYDSVTLSWTASASPVGLWGYVVSRGTSPSALAAIGSVKTGVTYSDTSAVPSTTYYYAVTADDVYGLASAQSSTLVVLTPKEPAPSAPSHLATQAVAYNDVSLSWTASSSPAGLWGYVVYRGTSPSTLAAIASVTTGASYTDATTAPSTTYYYAVTAKDTYGLASAQSAAVSVVTPKETAPSVPSKLTAQAVASTQVNLSWTASSSSAGIGGYAVYRGASPTSLAAIGTSKTSSYSDTTAQASTTYYYSVAAYDIYGLASSQSAVVSVTTP